MAVEHTTEELSLAHGGYKHVLAGTKLFLEALDAKGKSGLSAEERVKKALSVLQAMPSNEERVAAFAEAVNQHQAFVEEHYRLDVGGGVSLKSLMVEAVRHHSESINKESL